LSYDDILRKLDQNCSIRTLVYIEVYTFNSGIITVVLLVILSRIKKKLLQHNPTIVDYDYVLLQNELAKKEVKSDKKVVLAFNSAIKIRNH
jgi:hypothetical protein